MKKTMIVAGAALIIAASAHAQTIRDNCGCGIGTMALGDNEPTIVSQLAATFLNGICGNQTFGISSGTLECNEPEGFASNERVRNYVADNMDQLAIDMASGEGASLDAFADLIALPSTERAGAYARLQQNFERIFPAETVVAEDVVKSIADVLQS